MICVNLKIVKQFNNSFIKMDTIEIYFKSDHNDKKRYFRYRDDKSVLKSEIRDSSKIKVEPYFYFVKIHQLKDQLRNPEKRVAQLDEYFTKHDIDKNDKNKYKKEFLENKSKAGPYGCYKNFGVNNAVRHYKYFDDSVVPKIAGNIIVTKKDGIEPYKLIEDYEEAQDKIKELNNKIDKEQKFVDEIDKTREELYQEYQEKKRIIINREKEKNAKRKQREKEEEAIREQERLEKAARDRQRIYANREDSLITPELIRSIQQIFRKPNEVPNEVPKRDPFDINVEDEATDVEAIQCQICMDNKKKVVLNCGHALCVSCLKKIKNRICSECRQNITSTNVIYL